MRFRTSDTPQVHKFCKSMNCNRLQLRLYDQVLFQTVIPPFLLADCHVVSTTRPHQIFAKVDVLPCCPSPSLSTALERLDSCSSGNSSEAVILSLHCYKPDKLDRLVTVRCMNLRKTSTLR